jgi:hypothetical protein
MKLPVPSEYLVAALQDGKQVHDMTLKHRHVGYLILPTGELVACDPFVLPDSGPFNLLVPRGTFPVVLSVAQIATDQRIAFATIRFTQSVPTTWEMLTVGDQNISLLKEDELFGYPVDAGTGCFMDVNVSRALIQLMRERDNFYETLIAEMDKTYTNTWSWLDMKFGGANLIAFSSGYGDAIYASYAGFDSERRVSVVVTDFVIVPSEKSAP